MGQSEAPAVLLSRRRSVKVSKTNGRHRFFFPRRNLVQNLRGEKIPSVPRRPKPQFRCLVCSLVLPQVPKTGERPTFQRATITTMCSGSNAQEEKKEEHEHRVWRSMAPAAWHDSVAKAGSIFIDTYKATRRQIQETARKFDHDVILELGCGTGDVIGLLDTSIPHFGVDINPDFIAFCKSRYSNCSFEVVDATIISDWWKMNKFDEKYNNVSVFVHQYRSKACLV